MSRRRRLGLRGKLLLAALTLLAVPVVAFRAIDQMEAFLRAGQEQALLARAQALAQVLAERAGAIAHGHERRTALATVIAAHPLPRPPLLDGYVGEDEWDALRALAHDYAGDGLHARLLPGHNGDDLYLLLTVRDPIPHYGDLEGAGDAVTLHLSDPAGRPHAYRFAPGAPGRLTAFDTREGRRQPRIGAVWQESGDGYALELRIPLELVGDRIGLRIDDPDGGRSLAGPPSALLLPDRALEHLLGGAGAPGLRLRVVDRAGWVLADAGSLHSSLPEPPRELAGALIDLLYSPFVARPDRRFSDPLERAARLDGIAAATLRDAAGHSERRAIPGSPAVVTTAAWPIAGADGAVGAVVVEQTTNAILAQRNEATRTLVNGITVAFGAALLAVLLFATRLSLRVRRLRDEAEAAIGPDGKVRGAVAAPRADDELGDLNRSIAEMLRRIEQYTRYLEEMAGKLAHELRTPVVVVKSSLEGMASAPPEDAGRYAARASEGIARLETLLVRLSEATRLEQALQEAERERFDLAGLVDACVEGYRGAYPETAIERSGAAPLPVDAAPELIAQALDKLVNNARDFARPGTPIRIGTHHERGHAVLWVENDGPPLPQGLADRLFDSMVSARRGQGSEPHLGLGLYLVRLIAEFHDGTATARDLPGAAGVRFEVHLPRPAPP